jgi:plastocyanin
MRTPRIPAIIVVIALAAAACSNAASPTAPPAAAPSTGAAPSTEAAPSTGTAASTAASLPPASAASSSNAVSIKDTAFNPTTITVKAGDKVTWTNNDGFAHTVTLDDNSVDSGNLTPGATFANTFAAAGTFAYHCKIHSSMHGTVTVT